MPIEPEDLLPHFEREMALLRRSMRTFAERYPKIAARLAITGEHSEDPHVERLLQSFALMAAQHDRRLDDDVPEFTRALVDTIHGTFLRPFPSCAIAQFHGDTDAEQTEPREIARGTQLIAPVGRETFCTAGDVTLVPLSVSAARYTTSTVAPMHATLPPDTTGLLSFSLELTARAVTFAIAPDVLRLHLTGAREVVAALADGVLLHTACAFVELDGDGRWKRIDMPLAAAGFSDADALLPMPRDAAIAPFHLLMEYGAFPARFDCLDLDLARLKRTAVAARRITFHLALTGIHPDSHRAQRLAVISADNLRPFCTPVTNLFPGDAEPIETQAGLAYYALKPLSLQTAAATEVWSVDQVRQTTAQGTSILPPFESLRHATGTALGLYWTLLRDEARRAPRKPAEPPKPSQEVPAELVAAANANLRQGLELALVDSAGEPADPAGKRQLDVSVSCTNGNLSGMREQHLTLRGGAPAGDIVLLSPPSPSRTPAFRHGELWELLSWLTPQAVRLNADGLAQFKRLCTRFAMSAPDAGRRFDALVSLSTARVRRWMPGKPASAFESGLEIRFAIDEQRFAQFSLDGLGRVMDRLFVCYVPITSFVQVVLLSTNTGATLRCGELCPGVQPLV
ncbi:type VI secretion system baseplate subunit TssF [Burkholderia vietnamiensis]|uniref:type VI secretion system baseplate subunit TssF n=1 Tax=Burkholderia vietnamiensis TaxID=60552 RepID=UPI000841F469|nr:type VI secretion system baseplate subunit TssF [Burkholderia vietnamiensis]AOJ17488.1 type VI secretion protein [Burkholderia vietnamiensis]